MKKSVLIIVPVLLVILIVAGVGIGMHFSNNDPAPTGNNGTNQTDGEETQPQELKVDFFGEFEPFECSGSYTSYGYIGEVTNRDGALFFTRGESEKSKNHNVLAYVVNGEEKTIFAINNPDVNIEVEAYVDDALYFNVSNSDEMNINGFYRIWLYYNEAGVIYDSAFSFRFNQNMELLRAKDNTLLLKSDLGEYYYLFDTQTGEFSVYD